MALAFEQLSALGRARRLRGIVDAALPSWDLDVRHIRLLTNDFNGVFRIDTSEGPFVLRVSLPYRSNAQLRAECDWLRALHGVVDVPRPILTRAGDRWAVAEAQGVPGSRRCVLFTWMPGRAMRATDAPDVFAALGASTAALHAHAGDWRRPRGLLEWDHLFPYPAEPSIIFGLPLSKDARAIWLDAAQAAEEAFRAVAATGEQPRISHMDLYPANVRVHRGRVAILDFDDCMLAHPVQDLGVSAFRCRSRGVGSARLRAFRAGYERHAAWPDARVLEMFVAASALELANAVYQDFDPGYRAEADRLATKWARIAREAMRRI
jgi:Ser/Thr protein kinase RdoA (MazF antagonist)